MKRDVEFAKFFLLNAKVLEMVELATQRQSCDSKYLTKQHTKLQLKNRVSKDAQVLISCNSYSNDSMHIRHMHDMSIGDPCDRSLCSCRSSELLYAGVCLFSVTLDGILHSENHAISAKLYSAIHLSSVPATV